MKCSKCGQENAEGAKFCAKCGSSLATTKICPKCNKTVPLEQKFCSACGYKFASFEDFSKSADLSDGVNILGKLVCPCGSKDFKTDRIVVGGYNNDKSFARLVTLRYNYVCEKCGASVYNLCEDDESYFVFVPKEKAKEARLLSDTLEPSEERSFGRDFCIVPKFNDILVNADFDMVYHYLSHVLCSPANIVIGYVTKKEDDNTLEKHVSSKTWWYIGRGDAKSGRGELMTIPRENSSYRFQFGPLSTFAIDKHGKIVLNSDISYMPGPYNYPDEALAASQKYEKVIKAYRDAKDDYIYVYPVKSEKAQNKILEKLKISTMNLNFYAIVDNTLLGGDLVVVGLRDIWFKSRFSSIKKIALKPLKTSDMKHENGSMSIQLGNETINFRGPSADAVDKLFLAMKEQRDFLNGDYDLNP